MDTVKSPEPSSSRDPAQEKSPTAKLLEAQSLEILHCVNDRTFNTLLKYASPSFIDARPTVPGDSELSRHTSEEAIAYMEYLSKIFPDYTLETQSTLVDVNELTGYGTVWANILVVGRPDGMKMENVNQFRWRRVKEAKWVCVKHTVLSAMPAMTGL